MLLFLPLLFFILSFCFLSLLCCFLPVNFLVLFFSLLCLIVNFVSFIYIFSYLFISSLYFLPVFLFFKSHFCLFDFVLNISSMLLIKTSVTTAKITPKT